MRSLSRRYPVPEQAPPDGPDRPRVCVACWADDQVLERRVAGGLEMLLCVNATACRWRWPAEDRAAVLAAGAR